MVASLKASAIRSNLQRAKEEKLAQKIAEELPEIESRAQELSGIADLEIDILKSMVAINEAKTQIDFFSLEGTINMENLINYLDYREKIINDWSENQWVYAVDVIARSMKIAEEFPSIIKQAIDLSQEYLKKIAEDSKKYSLDSYTYHGYFDTATQLNDHINVLQNLQDKANFIAQKINSNLTKLRLDGVARELYDILLDVHANILQYERRTIINYQRVLNAHLVVKNFYSNILFANQEINAKGIESSNSPLIDAWRTFSINEANSKRILNMLQAGLLDFQTLAEYNFGTEPEAIENNHLVTSYSIALIDELDCLLYQEIIDHEKVLELMQDYMSDFVNYLKKVNFSLYPYPLPSIVRGTLGILSNQDIEVCVDYITQSASNLVYSRGFSEQEMPYSLPEDFSSPYPSKSLACEILLEKIAE